MPHIRTRNGVTRIQKLASLWPVVGIVGPRQSGKSTLLREQLKIANAVTLDDEDSLDDALNSAKVFLSKLPKPVAIDEIQKAPGLFDAIKAAVDRARRPGQYYLSGSSQFSARLGIRESLTGRIGLLRLYPLTLAEIFSEPASNPRETIRKIRNRSLKEPRFSLEKFSESLPKGGLPVPCFLRDRSAADLYWQGWLETTVHRDVARFFKRSYDPRVTSKLLRMIAQKAQQGEMAQLTDFDGIQRRTALNYLDAMESVFLIDRVSCHDQGIGKNSYDVFDSGLLTHQAHGESSPGLTVSQVRIQVRKEISANLEYTGERTDLFYFKSRKGTPVDFVLDAIPIKIVARYSAKSSGWDKRALLGSMRALESACGILLAPVSRITYGDDGVHVVPWSIFS